MQNRKLYIRDFLRCQRDTEAHIWLLIHQMFSPICFSIFSQLEQSKKITNFLMVPNRLFSLCNSWKKKTWQILIFEKKLVDSEFEIGENIWCIHYLSLNSQKIWNALAQIFISLGKMVRYYFFYPFYLHKKSWNLLHCLSLFLYTMAGIFRFCKKI